MLIIGWILRLVLLLLVLRLVLRFVKGLMLGLAGEQGRRPSVGASRQSRVSPVPLVRDPVCGTYVVAANALSLRAGGATHSFCSEACRNRFEREQAATRSA